MAKEKQEENKGPKATYRLGGSKVTVWENEIEGKYGKRTVPSFQITNNFKQGDEWKTNNSFNLEGALKLRVILDKAINEATNKEEEENE